MKSFIKIAFGVLLTVGGYIVYKEIKKRKEDKKEEKNDPLNQNSDLTAVIYPTPPPDPLFQKPNPLDSLYGLQGNNQEFGEEMDAHPITLTP